MMVTPTDNPVKSGKQPQYIEDSGWSRSGRWLNVAQTTWFKEADQQFGQGDWEGINVRFSVCVCCIRTAPNQCIPYTRLVQKTLF
jgi:hypothetical protein